MLEKRRKMLISHLTSEKNVDLAFIISPLHIYYYTGFQSEPHERFFALTIDTKTEKTRLFVPTLDLEAAQKVVEVDELIPISDSEDPYAILKNSLPAEIQTIAVEKSYLSLLKYEQLKALYPDVSFVNVENYIHKERMKKSSEEINHVRKAIEITEHGLKNTLEKITPGLTELQIKAELEYQLTLLGSEGLAFDTVVLSGKKSALPHGSAGHRKVQEGDILLFDLGIRISGYHSDITRTFVVGKSNEKQKEIYETVRIANERAIEAVHVGKPLKSIDLAARQYIDEKGYGQYFIHRTGHGLGLDVHEPPSIHHENEDKIEKGLLFTIEPGIYLPSIGGVRIEDNIYVNEQGKVEVLTTFPKIFTEIGG